MTPKYLFISKVLFFPKEGIVVIGDLHIGYEHMLRSAGLQLTLNLTNQAIDDLKKILTHIKSKYVIKKIIFIGDLKHYFKNEYTEKKEFFKILNFVEKFVNNPKEDIVLIKGNHDTFNITSNFMKNVYIINDIAFTHGHKYFKELSQSKIKYVVMGHLHPSIKLKDKAKSEKFKCFLSGDFKNKKFIVLPSFFNVIEGSDVNDFSKDYKDHFSIIPKRTLMKFDVHVINEDSFEVYNFGNVVNI